jgi:DNA-binding LacI/PurR family transcriptional regulator
LSLGRFSLRSAGPVLGLSCDWLDDAYQQEVVAGALAAARDRSARLVCFVGGDLTGSDPARATAFDLAGAESVDAMISLTGALVNVAGTARVAAFAERFRALPQVSVAGKVLVGVPEVSIDNAAGVERALLHLIREHGLTELCFVSGPPSNEEASARLATFREVLAAHSLQADARRIVTGDFSTESGVAAARTLLDERRVLSGRPAAVVASNDSMAMGVIAELARRGLRVPDDVAVVGFDDVEHARYASPPLTTVRQPFGEQGREAVRLALSALRGESPEDVLLRTELVVRRSCGCFSQAVGVPVTHQNAASSFEAALVERRQLLLAELARSARGRFGALGQGWETRLVNAFGDHVRSGSGGFVEVFDEVARRLAEARVDLGLLHDAISTLRRELLPCLSGDPERRALGGALLDEARRLTAEASERREARGRLEALRYGSLLARLSSNLAASFDPTWLEGALQRLEAVGIRSATIARYLDEAGPAGQAEILARAGNSPPAGYRGPARGIVRSVAETADGHCVMGLFQDRRLYGFAMFELSLAAGFSYESLRELASSALAGRALRERVRELESKPV